MSSDPPTSDAPNAFSSSGGSVVATRAAVRAALARAEQLARSSDGAKRRRAAEEQLHRALADLAHAEGALQGTIEEYEQVLDAFREAIRLSEALLRTLEHDVRGPLAVIKGRAQLLRRHAVQVRQPNAQLVRGLTEVDLAVDGLVRRLEALLAPAPRAKPPPRDGDAGS